MMNTSYGFPCALCDGLPCSSFMLADSLGMDKKLSKLVVLCFLHPGNSWLMLLELKAFFFFNVYLFLREIERETDRQTA